MKVKVDGRRVALEYRAIYDTPHYVALEVRIPQAELERLGYMPSDNGVVLDSAYRENSKIYADSMEDIDVYEMLAGKLKKLERLVASGSKGLTRNKLEQLMKEQGLDVTKPKTTARSGKAGKSTSLARSREEVVVRRSDGLYLKANGRWSKDRGAAKIFKTSTQASLAAYNAIPFSRNFEFDPIKL